MARVLVLDWDRTTCHVVAADLNRQGVDTGAAAVWRPGEDLSPQSAESLGNKLREFLKTSGLAAAPVLICVGRDRVVLKEITHPAASAQEEPAIVRFQATKDLAEQSEAVVLDYSPLTEAAPSGTRHSLAVILRRDILTSFQQLCRAAGLKLLGLVPRPFGAAGCLQLAQLRLGNAFPPGSSPEAVAVLVVGPRWAELNILQGSKLLFSRSLGVGPALAGEVRRNLMVFRSQPNGTFPRPSPQALYVAGNGTSAALLKSLESTLGVPVRELDFLTEKEKAQVPAEAQSGLVASLGLLQSWSQKQVPVNLASPREPAPVQDPGRRRKFLAAAGAAVVLLALYLYGQNLLARKKAQVRDLTDQIEEVQAQAKGLEQDKVDLDALKEWDKGSVRWIDEFYDLAARFPRAPGFRLTRIRIDPLTPKSAKDAFPGVARMTIQGVVPKGQEQLVHAFIDSMREPHLHVHLDRFRGEKVQTFSIRVDLAPQAPADYRMRLVPPAVWSTEREGRSTFRARGSAWRRGGRR